MKFADLHIHSTFSDSSYNLGVIFEKAHREGLSCISIVDHDTLQAYYSEQFLRVMQTYSLEIIPGIEFSSQYKDKEIHLLGYFPDKDVSREFLNILAEVRKDRLLRLFKMIDAFKKLGIDLDKEEFKSFVGEASLTRLHLASFLKYKGIVKDIREAFSKYLGVGKPCYILRFRYSLEEAIKLLKREKALVFLAHPADFLGQSQMKKLVDLGLDGIETFYSNSRQDIVEKYLELASSYGLLITGGSDSHGIYKKTDIGSIKLPYSYVERMKKCFLKPIT